MFRKCTKNFSTFLFLCYICVKVKTMSVASQLEVVKSTLPEGVTLVAVSKMHPAALITEAYEAGQRVFGESRPQELKAKYEILPKDIRWHMIGHLQTNKVKYIVPFVSLIESVDSAHLLEAIDKEAAKCGRTVDCLFEIHVAAEETKTGWNYDELCEYVAGGALASLRHVRMRGVMGIATNTDDFEKAVHALADVLGKQGATVSCITVCPNAKSMEDLQQMANEGFKPGNVYLPYIFDVEGIRGQV